MLPELELRWCGFMQVFDVNHDRCEGTEQGHDRFGGRFGLLEFAFDPDRQAFRTWQGLRQPGDWCNRPH